jgi:hypothetical protein
MVEKATNFTTLVLNLKEYFKYIFKIEEEHRKTVKPSCDSPSCLNLFIYFIKCSVHFVRQSLSATDAAGVGTSIPAEIIWFGKQN